ncbi:MAG: hypothetical protein JWQ35_985 [Bacteriovoracaceae bacterium]|nr:hypothetical protein [Bacteriovoracaceae bacterium]
MNLKTTRSVLSFVSIIFLNFSTAAYSQPFRAPESSADKLSLIQRLLKPGEKNEDLYKQNILKAVELIREIQNEYQYSIPVELLSAEAQSALGNQKISIAMFDKIIKADPENFVALTDRANAKLILNQSREAEDDLGRGLNALSIRWLTYLPWTAKYEKWTEKYEKFVSSLVVDHSSNAYKNLKKVLELTDRLTRKPDCVLLPDYDREFPRNIRSLLLNFSMLGHIYLSSTVDKLGSQELIGEKILECAMKIAERFYTYAESSEELFEMVSSFVIYRDFNLRFVEKLEDKINRYSLFFVNQQTANDPDAKRTHEVIKNNIDLKEFARNALSLTNARLTKLKAKWAAYKNIESVDDL